MSNTSLKTVTYDTYSDMFTDDKHMIENENYDNEIRWFEVPEEWANKWVKEHGFSGFEEFDNEYTWDDSIQMYEDAKAEGVLISTEIDQR